MKNKSILRFVGTTITFAAIVFVAVSCKMGDDTPEQIIVTLSDVPEKYTRASIGLVLFGWSYAQATSEVSNGSAKLNLVCTEWGSSFYDASPGDPFYEGGDWNFGLTLYYIDDNGDESYITAGGTKNFTHNSSISFNDLDF